MEEDKLIINKDFAKSYNKYRRAEELQKLEESCNKYADESSSSESEDEDAEEIDPKFEKKFFHVLAQLKSKDPAVYEQEENLFNDDSSGQTDTSENESSKSKKKNKEKPLYLKAYERKMALEGVFAHDDLESKKDVSDAPDSYYGQLATIKKRFADAAQEHDKKFQDGDGIDSLIKKKSTKRIEHDTDKCTKLDDLDDYWKNSELDDGEKYLRDFLLEKKYLASDSEDEKISHEVLLEEDDGFAEKQEMFEYKYNTRLENPDHHFIKSYPRIIASSVRRKDERRKKRREDREKRKNEQKKRKIEELSRLKRLKRESIMEKIERLKEATGNTDVGFSEQDIDDDFNPAEHDKRMQELFSDEFYAEVEDEKPQFSDIGEDEFGEETNWEEYENCDYDENLPACEQPDFVMDCDYEAEENKKSKRQLKREMKQLKKTSKPTSSSSIEQQSNANGYDESLPACEQPDFVMDCDYIPTKKSKRQLKKEKRGMSEEQFINKMNEEKSSLGEKSVNDHLEEYYAMDFDDVIGDLPCRFRYRTVAPSNFGLSTEDILLADIPTLNSWCPLSRVVAHRLPEDEFYLRQKYARKARSKRTKVFGKFYDKLKDKKNWKDLQQKTKDESSDEENGGKPENLSFDEKRENVTSEEVQKLEEVDKNIKKQKDNSNKDSNSKIRKLAKPSARQRRKNREREGIELNKVAKKGAWIKKQKNKSFQRLARIEPSVLKAYGLKPKRVIRQAKHDFIIKKKKRK